MDATLGGRPSANPSVRVLSAATFANTVGAGLWTASQVLYLTRQAGIGGGHVGLALSIGALAGLLAVVVAGRFVDRFDPRRARAFLQVLQALVMVGYLAVDALPALLLVASCEAALLTVGLTARAALIAGLAPDSRVRLHARLSSVAAVGFALGAAAAGVALSSGGAGAYRFLVLTNAMTFLVSAGLLMRLPRSPRPTATGARSRPAAALRDRRFVLVAAAVATLSLERSVVPIAVPLWVAQRAEAPAWTVGALLIVNTATTALLAVRISRGVETATPAARGVAHAGALFSGSMLVLALATGPYTRTSFALLLAAGAAAAVGGVLHGTATAGLVYDLSDPRRIGEYQSVHLLAQGLAHAAGAAVLSAAVLHGGPEGFLGLAALFAFAAAAVPSLTRQARSARPPEPAHA